MPFEAASVVIPSWNGAAILKPTLEALSRLRDIEFEVLVVDHGRSNLDTEALFSAYPAPRFRYLGLDEQLGFAGAVNYGVERANYRLVAVLCNDVIVEPDWLSELVRAFGEREQVGVKPVVSSLVTRPGFDDPLRHRINIWGRIVYTGEPAESYQPFFPDGSAFLFDRNALGKPFDADYFLYQEDVSLGWRSWLSGQEVILARKARALNADGGTTRRTPYRTAYFTERNRWLNLFSYLSLVSLLKLGTPLLLEAILRLVVGSNRIAKLHAWGWLLLRPGTILEKRRHVQAQRRRSDAEILPRISGTYVSGSSPLAKVLNTFWRGLFQLLGAPLGR